MLTAFEASELFHAPEAPALRELLEGGRLPALFSGLPAASRAQLAAVLARTTEQSVLVVCADDAAAEVFARDAAALLEREVPLLPARDYTFYTAESVSRQTEQWRLRALHALLTNEALQSYGSMLITATVPVDSRKDGLVFRSVLSRTPEVLSGDYIADTNSFYPGEPVVLGYLADPDISIRTLIFEEADPVFENGDSEAAIRSFSGTISFYNYGTGNFDDAPEGKRVFDSSDLLHYLSPDNMITVRYAETAAGIGGQLDAALPVVTVIGEEN